MKNLAVVAAGSGGHILPALVFAKEWKEQNKKQNVFFFGLKKNLDKKILLQSKYLSDTFLFKFINFPIKKFWLWPKFFIQFLLLFLVTFFYLKKYKIKRIVSTGGYIAIPICMAGKICRTKIDLFELNVQPGRAIKFLAFLANKIFITFEKSKKLFGRFSYKCSLRNYPLRFNPSDKIFKKKDLLQCFGFSQKRKTIFLFGGSKGSLFLDDIFKSWVNDNSGLWDKIQVIHQTGSDDLYKFERFYSNKNISSIVFNYTSNIKNFYLIADLILSRAGAGALFELAFFKKKSLIVPLQVDTTGHQLFNAQEMQRNYPDFFNVLNQSDIEGNKDLFYTATSTLLGM